ncbi:MAG: cytochrome-c peroxidase [Betaproteobacteria bacterium]
MAGVKRRVLFAVVVACAAAALLWQGARVFLAPRPPSTLAAVSYIPPATAEPISPIPRSLALDARKVVLGRRLFHDPRLSRDDSVACASCHDLAKGGADGRDRSVGIGGQRTGRNSPTVFNAVFSFVQFWDGRAASLEDQIDGPLNNPAEMGSSWPAVVAKLAQDPQYVAAFRGLYGGIDAAHIKNAIAEFERSLITPRSRFDRHLEGERGALSAAELKGYQLFKSYGCIACHQGVNVGGNMYQRLGVAQAPGGGSEDPGRMKITGQAEDRFVFKVPGLRNVALTAPYFHDGSVQTLEEAVVLMGRYQLGVVIPAADVALIAAFLHTLTGDLEAKAP